MNYSKTVKAMLLASINDLASDPEKYAVQPGKDFTRNRKMGFRDFLLLFLTMEADSIKEELYRYFSRVKEAPSKAAFYKQRRKLRSDALRRLLILFEQKCKKKLFNDKYRLVACDGSSADIFRNPNDEDTFLNLMGNQPGDLIRSTFSFRNIHSHPISF